MKRELPALCVPLQPLSQDGTVRTVRAANGRQDRLRGKRMKNGFGYDPIFYLPEYGCSSAELSMEEKNKISHRGKALRAIRDELQ
mgnify:CR=1 FL=1